MNIHGNKVSDKEFTLEADMFFFMSWTFLVEFTISIKK